MNYRRRSGSVISMLPMVLLVVALAAAAFAFDYGHGLSVRRQLQNATDAAALAGAYELAKDPLTGSDKTNAEKYAYDVAAKNYADDVVVSNNPTTTVTVTVNANAMPRSVTVTSTRTSANIFARLLGFNTIPVSTTSTASSSQGIKQVKPNQLFPLAVSLDFRPTKGAQEGVALQDLVNNNKTGKFTIVLNPQNSKNGSWLKNWVGTQNELLTFGKDALIMNGVMGNQVQDLSPGDVLNIPIITGPPPFNKERIIVGVMGFRITKINFPLEIEGYLVDPVILRGTPGMPLLEALDQGSATFLNQHQPWQVSLTN